MHFQPLAQDMHGKYVQSIVLQLYMHMQDGGDTAPDVTLKFDPHKDYYKVRPLLPVLVHAPQPYSCAVVKAFQSVSCS